MKRLLLTSARGVIPTAGTPGSDMPPYESLFVFCVEASSRQTAANRVCVLRPNVQRTIGAITLKRSQSGLHLENGLYRLLRTLITRDYLAGGLRMPAIISVACLGVPKMGCIAFLPVPTARKNAAPHVPPRQDRDSG